MPKALLPVSVGRVPISCKPPFSSQMKAWILVSVLASPTTVPLVLTSEAELYSPPGRVPISTTLPPERTKAWVWTPYIFPDCPMP